MSEWRKIDPFDSFEAEGHKLFMTIDAYGIVEIACTVFDYYDSKFWRPCTEKELVDGYRVPDNQTWTKVTDQKPDENQEILMSYNKLIVEGLFKNGSFYYTSSCAHVKGYCNCEPQEGITHWMPLPGIPND